MLIRRSVQRRGLSSHFQSRSFCASLETEKKSVKFESKSDLLPRDIIAELDRYVVGQSEAKKVVAVALRNRWRRKQLPEDMQDEVIPKNILMIGPTGVGKTEIARRLGKLCNAPFLKVEATKFTEIGFHGRDVDQIIRDLVAIGISDTKKQLQESRKEQVAQIVEDRLMFGLLGEVSENTKRPFLKMLRQGVLDDVKLNVFIQDEPSPNQEDQTIVADNRLNLQKIIKQVQAHAQGKQEESGQNKTITIKEARQYLETQESEHLDKDELTKLALESVQENGIVFIDEIDKICQPSSAYSGHADASSEGVQRDLLPLIEGSVISTKHGDVDTSKILFIASGAFYASKPSDLLPELQGRLPIRVNLLPLTEKDLYKILVEPEYNLLMQQVAMIGTEDIKLNFQEDAISEIARVAAELNRTVENIGARRLHTIIEKLMENISFDCVDAGVTEYVVSAEMVKDAVKPLQKRESLSHYIL